MGMNGGGGDYGVTRVANGGVDLMVEMPQKEHSEKKSKEHRHKEHKEHRHKEHKVKKEHKHKKDKHKDKDKDKHRDKDQIKVKKELDVSPQRKLPSIKLNLSKLSRPSGNSTVSIAGPSGAGEHVGGFAG